MKILILLWASMLSILFMYSQKIIPTQDIEQYVKCQNGCGEIIENPLWLHKHNKEVSKYFSHDCSKK